MLVELHTHTKYSKQAFVPVEGLNTPEEMVAHAKKIGLGAIAITDHDEIKGALEAMKYAKKYDIIVIPGIEITTYSGHILALGIEEAIPSGMRVEDTIDEVHSQGGIAIGDHPFDIKNEGIGEKARLTDAVEIFNAINIERFSNLRAKKFAKVWKKPMVAGSDAHTTDMIGHGINKIDADNIDDILNAIKKGDVEIMAKYIPSNIIMRWSVRRLQLSYPYVMNHIDNNYNLPKRIISRNLLRLVKKSPGNIDYFFKGLTYIGVASAITYSAMREIKIQLS